jgi:hypothetical protein
MRAYKPTEESFYVLFSVFMILSFFSLLLTLFYMDNVIDETSDQKQQVEKISFGKRFLNEIYNLAKLYSQFDVWLLFPLTFYYGFEMTYVWFEYSRVNFKKFSIYSKYY